MVNLYAPTKALRHLDIIQATREDKPARPAHVYLLVCDACQQNCAYCAYRAPDYESNKLLLPVDGSLPRRMMPIGKALEVIDDCAELGVQAIQISGGGEPTMYPELARVLRACRARGIAHAVTTNAILVEKRGLTDDIAQGAWVRVSIDTASPEIYAEMRRVPLGEHQKACSSIRALREARDRIGTACVIGVSAIVGAKTWRGVRDAARMARELGADNFNIAPEFTPDGMATFDGYLDEMELACKEAELEQTPTFRVYNRVADRLSDLRRGKPSVKLCGHQFFTTYVGSDLNVYRCCVIAYNEAGIVGSITTRRFRDLWMSEERMENLRGFDPNSCQRCPYQVQNDLLEFALAADEPTHAHFV